MYVCMYSVYMSSCARVYIRMCVCMYVCMHCLTLHLTIGRYSDIHHYIHIYIYIYIYIYAHIHTYIHTYTHTCTYSGNGTTGVIVVAIIYVGLMLIFLVGWYTFMLNAHMRGRILDTYRRYRYVCMCVCMCVCACYVCVYVCMCVCVCVCMYVCMLLYILNALKRIGECIYVCSMHMLGRISSIYMYSCAYACMLCIST
jgi:hypothetical protein